MRNPFRATTVASAVSILLGALLLGCPGGGTEPGPTGGTGGATGGSGGDGGSAGTGGSGGTGGSACMDGESQSCYSGPSGTEGLGACKPGTKTCSAGQWGECTGEVLPGTETCNGADDDCNGKVDDLPPITCGVGACQAMIAGCIDAMVPECVPGEPQSETCDGTDEDCDGQIDNGDVCPCTEGTTQSCYSGNPATKDVGECKSGTQTCVGGSWGACENEVLPGMEVCDGLDNDCNGQDDNDIPQLTCGAGACLVNVAACANGMPQTCTPGTPKAEICNGIDDDCNLFVDDNLGSFTCGTGACKVTVPACAGGMPQTCMAGMPQTEICDGTDNDCDGITDEGNPGGGVSCMTGLSGACATGSLVCTNGALQCQPMVMPVPDICDGLDNDCDGMIDEGNPGGGQGCNVPGKFGPCASGTTTCMGGAILCNQVVFPSTEECDGIDNDCDGATDEGTSGQLCAVPGKLGACAVSTSQCMNGSLFCPQTVFPATEICNGTDDNCNGQTDENNPQGGGACSVPGKVGECVAGTQTCSNGSLVCNQINQPTPDTCGDNKDNDCDGTVDEGTHSVCTSGPAMSATTCTGNPCIASICAYNGATFGSCCTGNWTLGCTVVADFACGAGSCCAHNICTLGGPLSASCSSCVAAVCNILPKCCTTGWDADCRTQTSTTCLVNCGP